MIRGVLKCLSDKIRGECEESFVEGWEGDGVDGKGGGGMWGIGGIGGMVSVCCGKLFGGVLGSDIII